MKTLNIIFLNGDKFYPGHTLYGRVVCENTEPIDVRNIELKIVGKGKVRWTETRTRNGHTRVIVHSNEEKYFKHKIHMFGSGERSTLESGEHAFDFNFVIPNDIPATFHSDYGKIEYTVKAKVDIPWAVDLESDKEFYVKNYITFDDCPAALEHASEENSKYLCCCCCRSGPIKGRCWLPKQGYVPGELMSVSAEMENLSNRSMRRSYLKLIQKIRYHATSKTRTCEKELFSVERPGFEREDYWSDYKITAPDDHLSPFRFTNLIDIDYQVQLVIEPRTCSINLRVKVPIMIFSAPINPNSENPVNNRNEPTAQPPLANAGFSVPPIPYPGGPVSPPNDSNLPYPTVMPSVGVGFILPGQPHPGGYSCGPVPSAPIIAQPPEVFPIVQPPQGGSSYVRAPDSHDSQPPSYDECVHKPAASSGSVVAPPTLNPLEVPPSYAINISVPYSYTPAVDSMSKKD